MASTSLPVDAEGALRLQEVGSGKETLLENIGASELPALQFSPEGRWLAAGEKTGQVRLWDAATGQVARQLEGHTGAITALAFRRDGQSLATADSTGEVRLWELASKQSHSLGRHERAVLQLASPDGRRLISGSMDHTLRIWDLVSVTTQRVDISGSGLQQILMSQDGKLLISASLRDTSLRLWDAQTGKRLGMLQGHQGEILSMALSPDGRRVASASPDFSVRLWNLETHESRVLRGHTARVTGVVFLDDQNLASIGWGGTVRLWRDDLPSDPAALRTRMAAVEGTPPP